MPGEPATPRIPDRISQCAGGLEIHSVTTIVKSKLFSLLPFLFDYKFNAVASIELGLMIFGNYPKLQDMAPGSNPV
jgi:hypothetical protein